MRSRRTFHRRRRPGMDLYPLSICDFAENIVTGGCTSTQTFATPLIYGAQSPSFAKGVALGGLGFDYFYSTIGSTLGNNMFVTVRTALMVIDCDFSGAPARTPDLFNVSEANLSDILWRAQDFILLNGAAGATSSTPRREVPVKVKTKRNLKENSGLFWVFSTYGRQATGTFPLVLNMWGYVATRIWNK